MRIKADLLSMTNKRIYTIFKANKTFLYKTYKDRFGFHETIHKRICSNTLDIFIKNSCYCSYMLKEFLCLSRIPDISIENCLTLAADTSRWDLVVFLLRKGLVRDKYSFNEIVYYISTKLIENRGKMRKNIFRLFLKRGFEIDYNPNHCLNLLELAARIKHNRFIEFLVKELGANVNLYNNFCCRSLFSNSLPNRKTHKLLVSLGAKASDKSLTCVCGTHRKHTTVFSHLQR